METSELSGSRVKATVALVQFRLALVFVSLSRVGCIYVLDRIKVGNSTLFVELRNATKTTVLPDIR